MPVLQVTEFGDPSVLKVIEMPEPTAGDTDIKIKVEGVGIGFFDGLLIKGEKNIYNKLLGIIYWAPGNPASSSPRILRKT